MFTKEDIKYASEIVSAIQFPEPFGGYEDLNTDEYTFQIENVMRDDYFVSCGVSKLVIIPDETSFVVKIPFDGRWLYAYDDDGEIIDDPDLMEFYEFDGAEADDVSDYCADELSRTISIQDAGYGCFVPDMMYLGEFNGHKAYLQEKAKPLNELKRLNATPGSIEKAKKSTSSFRMDWEATVYDLYGEEKWHEFLAWVKVNEPEVLTDLHSGNYGLSIDGHPVLFDISGFRD